MVQEIFPIQAIGNGFLYMMARPYVGLNKYAIFDEISRTGISLMVSLLPFEESQELGLENQANLCESFNIDFVRLPIDDFMLPADVNNFVTTIRNIHSVTAIGVHVVVHCRAGIGRSGLAACTMLMCEGLSAENAIIQVKQSRGCDIPDTEEQTAFIFGLEKEYFSTR